VYGNTSGAGAADPKAIDFLWHQRNFENALDALRNGEKPVVDGSEGRRAVELITAIYQSMKNGGAKVSL
jgi:predicted dehydrogenase